MYIKLYIILCIYTHTHIFKDIVFKETVWEETEKLRKIKT